MINIKKEELKYLYVDKLKSIKELAEYFKCDNKTITRRLEKFGLKTGVTYKQPKKKIDPLKNKKEQIKELYLSGLSCSKIGLIVGLSERTVNYHLKQMNVFIRPQKKIIHELFVNMWNENKSDLEIANTFGVSENTIKCYRNNNPYHEKYSRQNYFSKKEKTLSYIQKQFILGSLLGDLALQKPYKKYTCRLTIKHSVKQQALFEEKCKILGEFMGSKKIYIASPDKRTGNIYTSCTGQSKAHPEFDKIYNILYIDGKKVITKEYLALITHPIALAYWFMDDGCKKGTFATNCFSEQEIDLLISWLNAKWNIECTKQKNLNNYVIHIKNKSREAFENLIYPYIIPEMKYKLIYTH